MKRHIAKTTTDERCVVLFMQIPGRESHALICPTDSLPDRLEQAVMDVVESSEGQANPTLATVLGRRLLPDTGENIMQALHDRGHLHAVPIDNVLMLPMPNMPFPLRGIIEQMGGDVPTTTQTPVSDSNQAETKFNPHANITQSESSDQSEGIAQNLLVEAQMLQSEADKKRERAYSMAPQLRPQVTEDTAVSVTKKARTSSKKSSKEG